jgi:hypothetical protein
MWRPASHEVETMHKPEDDCRNYVPTMEFEGFGRAYVPQQRLCELFSGIEGFVAGTIFPELYMPYEGKVLSGHNLKSEEGDNFA